MKKVTCALIFEKGKFLVTQRGSHPHHSYQWEFPGGKMARGESEEQCVRREIKEELNIGVKVVEKLHPVKHNYNFNEIELIPFVCKKISGELKLSEHIDFKWLEWFEIENEDISEADKQLLTNPANQLLLEKYSG
jgi:8-oxo-dGTP diphosphatase